MRPIHTAVFTCVSFCVYACGGEEGCVEPKVLLQQHLYSNWHTLFLLQYTLSQRHSDDQQDPRMRMSTSVIYMRVRCHWPKQTMFGAYLNDRCSYPGMLFAVS